MQIIDAIDGGYGEQQPHTSWPSRWLVYWARRLHSIGTRMTDER